jgi:hypothetical protein
MIWCKKEDSVSDSLACSAWDGHVEVVWSGVLYQMRHRGEEGGIYREGRNEYACTEATDASLCMSVNDTLDDTDTMRIREVASLSQPLRRRDGE